MWIKHLRSEVDPNSLTAVQQWYDDIIELNSRYGPDKDFNPFLYEIFIAYNEFGLCGFGCIGEQKDGTGNVLRYDLVAPEYWGLKIQKRLIKARLEYLRLQGYGEVRAYASPENLYSLNNLVDCGFRFDKEHLVEFGGGEGHLYQSLKCAIL